MEDTAIYIVIETTWMDTIAQKERIEMMAQVWSPMNSVFKEDKDFLP